MKKTHIATLLVATVLTTGCVMRSEYQAPELDMPDTWNQSTSTRSVSIDQWWTQFNDPVLNQIIQQVLAKNNDLAIATLTLRQARLQADLGRDDFYPDTSLSGSGTRSKSLDSGQSSTSYNASLGVSYELDLWGRVSAYADQTKWTAMATEQDREATAQSLVATTATLYWQIGYLHDRLALGEENIRAAQETLNMSENQYQNGAVSKVNVLQAKQSLAALQTQQSQYQQQLVEAQNAFAILFDQAPQSASLLMNHLPSTPIPQVAVGIPSDLLARRPDVKAKLYELKAALASKDQTAAAYMPSLTLTGSMGGSSSALHNLLTDPIGTLGANLALPFIQWDEMDLNKQIADAQYQSTIIDYRQTLYAAFQDVDNALSSKQQLAYQSERLREQYQSAEEVARIYDNQYQNGAIEFRDLLDAQTDERNAKASVLQNRYNQYVAMATLYQALGGQDVMPETKEGEAFD
ncbi:efflux transporter outer membrane subunit [Vibrio sp. AK197]